LTDHDLEVISATAAKGNEKLSEDKKKLVRTTEKVGSANAFKPQALPVQHTKEMERECGGCHKTFLPSRLSRCQFPPPVNLVSKLFADADDYPRTGQALHARSSCTVAQSVSVPTGLSTKASANWSRRTRKLDLSPLAPLPVNSSVVLPLSRNLAMDWKIAVVPILVFLVIFANWQVESYDVGSKFRRRIKIR
jgi:hypothetical protein